MSQAPSPATVDEAVSWLVRLRYTATPDPLAQSQWRQWRDAHPTHAEAWRRVAGLADEVCHLRQPEIDATWGALRRQRQGRRALLGLGLLTLAGSAGLAPHVPWQRWVADHHTEPGEQRRLALADDTVVHLNTDTAINVQQQGDARALQLLRGEILIHGPRDAAAWTVHTAQGTLHPQASRYQVRLHPNATEVTVLEGTVHLLPRHATPPGALAEADTPWLMYDDHAGRSAPGPLRAGAWVEQVLSVRDMPLDAALQEIGRYRPGHLSVDPQLASRRLSGLYHLGNIDRLLRFIADTEGLVLHERTRYWLHIAPRDDRRI